MDDKIFLERRRYCSISNDSLGNAQFVFRCLNELPICGKAGRPMEGHILRKLRHSCMLRLTDVGASNWSQSRY